MAEKRPMVVLEDDDLKAPGVYGEMSTDINGNGAVLEDVEIDLIDLAENQPRKLKLSKDDIIQIRDGEKDILSERGAEPKFKERWESFLSLAQSVEHSGVKQPVKLFRKGPRFEILFGERRTLASLFKGKTTVPALVYADQPTKVEAYEEALAENAARDDLLLKEDVDAILEYFIALQVEQNRDGTVKDVMNVGYKKTKAYKLFKLVSAGDILLELIDADRILQIKVAVKFSELSLKDQKEISKKKDGEITEITISDYLKGKPKGRRAAGAPVKHYQLGKINSSKVMKEIVSRVGVRIDDLDSIDWDDKKSVNELWIKMISKLEEELK